MPQDMTSLAQKTKILSVHRVRVAARWMWQTNMGFCLISSKTLS